MFKYTSTILIFLILFGCKTKKEGEHFKNEIIENKIAKLEKIGEIKIEEKDTILIGLVYLFEFNPIEKTILFVDPIFCELKIYSDNGKFIKKIGKQGEAPGEFRRIMGFAKDTRYYYIADDMLHRISVFTKDGIFVKSFKLPKDIDLNPGEMVLYNDKIYISAWQIQYKPIIETYKAKPITVLDTNGNILYHYGNYDDIYRKYKLLWTSPKFDIDEKGNTYISSYLGWKIFKYDESGNLIKSFGVKGNSFEEVKKGMRGDESIEELKEIALKRSYTSILKYSKKYIYYQYSKSNVEFYTTKSRKDKEHFLMLYTNEGEYIKSDIKLPGGGMLDVDENGIIYIELSDEPGNRIIGKYKLKIIDEN